MMGDSPPSGSQLLTLARSHSVVDLTHKIHPDIPVWPGHPPMCHTLCASYAHGDASKFYSLSMGEHTGTHLDAPIHFIPGGAAVDEIPVTNFVSRLATVGVNDYQAGELVSADVILRWEKRQGPLQKGDSILFHFGWDRYFNHQSENFLAGWPGLTENAAALLVERGLDLVGCDCLSIDGSLSETFPAHRVLLGNGVLIGENFANLGKLPPWSILFGLPLPILGGTGAPLRALALIDR